MKVKITNAKKPTGKSADYVQSLPSLSFDETQMKGLDGLEIDEEVTFTVKAKVTSLDRSEWGDKKISARFKVISGEMHCEDDDDDEEMKSTLDAKKSIMKKS